MNRIRPFLLAAASLVCALLVAGPARAQVAPHSTALRVSVIENISDGATNTIATLGQARDGSIALIVRSFLRRDGLQQGSPLVVPLTARDAPVDVLLSTVFEPGSVLVLDAARRAHVFPLGFRADGTPFLAASSSVLGPLGPSGAGAATALGEAPNPDHPDDPFLAVGTMLGEVVITTRGIEPVCSPVAAGPIQDLGPISQVGHFSFGAVSNGTLFLLNPDGAAATRGLQPQLTASLRDPRRAPLIDFGSPVLTHLSRPTIDPIDVPVVTANGTTEIATLEIPKSPGLGGALTVLSVDPVCSPVKQVVFGSLTWLPVDGSGVLYNRGFTFEEGLVGREWTIAGASMEIAPATLNLKSRGRFVTVIIEGENNRAAEIALTGLRLSVDGAAGAVAASAHPSAELIDHDGDASVDLKVKFDRAALVALLGQTEGETAIVRASWLYGDGTEGTASAQARITR